MLKHDNLADPPVVDLVDKILSSFEWERKESLSSDAVLSNKEIEENVQRAQEEMRTATTAVLDIATSTEPSTESAIKTEDQAYMRLKQVQDVGKALACFYAAQGGRVITMGKNSNE
jgi:hypothetical protein